MPFSGESGARLAQLCAIGHSGAVLPKYFDMVNVLDYFPGRESKGDLWPWEEAKIAGRRLADGLLEPEQAPRRILLMGRNVERAILGRNGRLPWLTWKRWERHLIAVFPHPSGINHWWNDEKHRNAAEDFMRELMKRARTQ